MKRNTISWLGKATAVAVMGMAATVATAAEYNWTFQTS